MLDWFVDQLTLSRVVIFISTLILIKAINKFVIAPYRLIRFYRKQGIPFKFVPIGGWAIEGYKSLKKKQDFGYPWKQYGQMENRPKAFGGNLLDFVEIFLTDPELIKQFLSKPENYTKHEAMWVFVRELAGEGLFFSEGKNWKRHRKHASMAFHYQLLKDLVPTIVKVTDSYFASNLKKRQDLGSVNILKEFKILAGIVVQNLFFGPSSKPYSIGGKLLSIFADDLFKRITDEMMNPITLIGGVKLWKLGIFKKHRELINDINAVRQLCKEIIEEQSANLKAQKSLTDSKKSLFEIFLEQREQNTEEPFTDVDLIDTFMTFLLGGTETTGQAIGLATYFFLKNPQYKDELMKEINKYFADDKLASVDLDTLNQMEFTNAFLKETLRVVPSAPVLAERFALEDHMIGDIKIKKGTALTINVIGNHHDQRVFENPETFNPYRWINGDAATKNLSYIYLPFSGGPRNCIGQQLAMNEAKIIFGLFLKHFNFAFTDKDYNLSLNWKGLYMPEKEVNYNLSPSK